jgi:hypothetical protein
MQYVEMNLIRKKLRLLAGSFMMMDNGIKMETILAMVLHRNKFLINYYLQETRFNRKSLFMTAKSE